MRGLLVLVLLFLAQPASAQATGAISPSVVLVLKLVSSTHVKPTTGIVISDQGLVLVSADFAATEGEIIVLDGGTDILSHGRPASVFHENDSGKLSVLSVEGLKRPPIVLSENLLDSDSDLRLEAFPPAEYIAKGEPPLVLPVSVVTGVASMQLSISPETPLPYVSGAIIDQCGYLAGVSLSSGTQSLEAVKAPKTVFNKELAAVLLEMQVSPATARCESPGQSLEPPVVLTKENDVAVEPEKPVEQSQDTDDIEAAEPDTTVTVDSDEATPSEHGIAPDPVEQVNTNNRERPSLWRIVPLWLILAVIIVLTVLIWKLVYYYRLHRKDPVQISTGNSTREVQSASDEPVTAPLDIFEGENDVKPRSAPALDLEIPELANRPEGCDAVLLVEGYLDPETGFRRFCFVNSEKINIVIGRGDTDIAIEHAAISRAHVRLESDGDLITLSDLGSRNGTFIGDIPCLQGEIMYLDETDDIYLGDVKLSIRLIRQEAEWA
jgi:hypothetical protein